MLSCGAQGEAACFLITCFDPSGQSLLVPDPALLTLNVSLSDGTLLDAQLLQTGTSRDGKTLEVSYAMRKAGNCKLDVRLADFKSCLLYAYRL